jgi:hypothetical protein
MSWCRAPSGAHDQIFVNSLPVTVLSCSRALSDERSCLSLVSHSLQNYITVEEDISNYAESRPRREHPMYTVAMARAWLRACMRACVSCCGRDSSDSGPDEGQLLLPIHQRVWCRWGVSAGASCCQSAAVPLSLSASLMLSEYWKPKCPRTSPHPWYQPHSP